MSNVIYNESTHETPQETSQENLPPLSNQQLHDMVSDLFTEYRTLKRETGAGTHVEARIDACKDVIGLSYRHNGRKPSGSVLDRLGTYLILDHLTDRHPDKMTREETPVQSIWQEIYMENRTSLLEELFHDGRHGNGRRKSVFDDQNDVKQVSNGRMPNVEDDEISNADMRIIVEDLLVKAKLTDRQRQAIELVYFEDMTQEKAAEVMGVGRATVETLLRRSLHYIRGSVRNIID